jgi:hypothetical protein
LQQTALDLAYSSGSLPAARVLCRAEGRAFDPNAIARGFDAECD